MAATFSQIDLVVADVGASVAFYRRLGVDIPDEGVWEQDGRAHHVEVDLSGGTKLGLDSVDLTRAYDTSWPSSATGSIMIFSVPDRASVDRLFRELTEAGYAAHMPPTDAFWGARYAIVDDPDGNHVGVMSPSDREHQRPPGL